LAHTFLALVTVGVGHGVYRKLYTLIGSERAEKFANHWFKCSDTYVVLQTAIFLILFVVNNKRSSGIDGRTSDCLSRISLYYRYLELRFC